MTMRIIEYYGRLHTLWQIQKYPTKDQVDCTWRGRSTMTFGWLVTNNDLGG